MNQTNKAIDVSRFFKQKRGILEVDLRMLWLSVQFERCQQVLQHALEQNDPALLRDAYERYIDRVISEVQGLPFAWTSMDLLLGHSNHEDPDLHTIVSFMYACYSTQMTIPLSTILRLVEHFEGQVGPVILH